MSNRSFITSLQTFLGATKNELIVVAVVLAGLAGGVVLRTVQSDAAGHAAVDTEEFNRLLDSVARAEQTTYTGVTPDGEPVPELAAGDTVVAPETPFPAAKAKALPEGVVDLNTATREELMRLPGVGPATADKILAYRSEQPFRRPEDVMRIKGIGVKKFEAMRRFITVQSR